ncbi:MAG: GPR endopeptidase [Christensenellales bacterium]|jgi:spore protease
MRQIRTDLAMESVGDAGAIPGVEVNHWENAGVYVTEVVITDQKSAVRLGKPIGNYITLESQAVKKRDVDARLGMAAMIGEEIARMIGDVGEKSVMVVGLGNRMITPDSLGPLTVDRTLVTRHIFTELSQYADERMRSVCAVAPGVLGVTGIETAEMLESIVMRVDPACIVVVDALAARATGRIGAAVQIADTGIQPGSGVGNHRAALTREKLGVPVVAVGMPTVIYAATLARDAFEAVSKSGDSEEALSQLERELMDSTGGDMIVTPREIDELIKDSAGMIAAGINRALQPQLSDSEILAMMD